jgi:hypothetical protein
MNKNKRQNHHRPTLHRTDRGEEIRMTRHQVLPNTMPNGEFLVAAKAFHKFLTEINAEISGAWIPLTLPRNQPIEPAPKDAAELHQCEIQILYSWQSLNKSIQCVLDEFREILPPQSTDLLGPKINTGVAAGGRIKAKEASPWLVF